MATIVRLKNSDKHALLVGSGHGMFKSSTPHPLFGNLLASHSSGQSHQVALATSTGEILWCESELVEIVSIDGQSPAELLSPYHP